MLTDWILTLSQWTCGRKIGVWISSQNKKHFTSKKNPLSSKLHILVLDDTCGIVSEASFMYVRCSKVCYDELSARALVRKKSFVTCACWPRWKAYGPIFHGTNLPTWRNIRTHTSLIHWLLYVFWNVRSLVKSWGVPYSGSSRPHYSWAMFHSASIKNHSVSGMVLAS